MSGWLFPKALLSQGCGRGPSRVKVNSRDFLKVTVFISTLSGFWTINRYPIYLLPRLQAAGICGTFLQITKCVLSRKIASMCALCAQLGKGPPSYRLTQPLTRAPGARNTHRSYRTLPRPSVHAHTWPPGIPKSLPQNNAALWTFTREVGSLRVTVLTEAGC